MKNKEFIKILFCVIFIWGSTSLRPANQYDYLVLLQYMAPPGLNKMWEIAVFRRGAITYIQNIGYLDIDYKREFPDKYYADFVTRARKAGINNFVSTEIPASSPSYVLYYVKGLTRKKYTIQASPHYYGRNLSFPEVKRMMTNYAMIMRPNR